MADPADEAAIKAVRLAAERDVVPVVVPVEELIEAYARLFESGSRALKEIVDDLGTPSLDDTANVEQLIDLAKEAPVVRLVNQLLTDALRSGASDIHVEPYPDRLSVRYRVHGRLKEIGAPPANLAAAVVSRIKILAKLDIAERRLPQDGRSQLALLGRPIDLRVATMPTIHGESLVIRLLDQAAGSVELAPGRSLGRCRGDAPAPAQGAARHDPGDRPDRQRQDDDALWRAANARCTERQDHLDRGSDRVSDQRRDADPGEAGHRAELCPHPALGRASRSECHHGGRDPRCRDRRDRRACRADRPSDADHVAHQQRRRDDCAAARHGRRALSAGFGAALRHRPASRRRALRGLQGAIHARRSTSGMCSRAAASR